MIEAARCLTTPIPVDDPKESPEVNQYVARMVNGLIDASDYALHILEATAIRDGDDKEPLDTAEEAIFNHLQKILKFGDEEFASLTHSQKFSAARVIAKQGQDNMHPVDAPQAGEYLGLPFRRIFIGIEPDGYAHS